MCSCGAKHIEDNKFIDKDNTTTRTPQGSLQKTNNMANISKHKFTRHSLSFLNKGLPFIPTQSNPMQNLKLTDDLQNLKDTYIDKYKYQVLERAERMLKSTLHAIQYDLERCKEIPVPSNISSKESLPLTTQ